MPKLGALVVSRQRDQAATIRARLIHAGYFHKSAPYQFFGVLVCSMVLFTGTCGLLTIVAGLSWRLALMWLPAGPCLGYLLPYYWLLTQEKKRQRLLSSSLPDALDILVLCLEGGISLNASIQWLSGELKNVHPVLAAEINVVQGEMQLGLSAGNAFLNFAKRCGLADVRELASVIVQSERYGASIARALRTFADTARQERQARIEEAAQKASVKILFPTLLCIFPAIFIVLLGPAAFQMAHLFSK